MRAHGCACVGACARALARHLSTLLFRFALLKIHGFLTLTLYVDGSVRLREGGGIRWCEMEDKDDECERTHPFGIVELLIALLCDAIKNSQHVALPTDVLCRLSLGVTCFGEALFAGAASAHGRSSLAPLRSDV